MRPFIVDDLLKLNQFAHRCPWDLSPDGELLAVALSEANRREPLGDESSARTIHGVHLESNGAHLLLLDTATGESIVPFPEASMSWAGRWSPDGQTLAAFVVAPQTQACVGLWDRRTREVRLFRDAAVHCGLNFCVPQWTPDGLRIVVRAHSCGYPSDSMLLLTPTSSSAPMTRKNWMPIRTNHSFNGETQACVWGLWMLSLVLLLGTGLV